MLINLHSTIVFNLQTS